jgi:hypothetical protein
VKKFLVLFAVFVGLNLPVYAQDDEPIPQEPAGNVTVVVEDTAPPVEDPGTDPALVAFAVWFAMAGAVTGFLEQFKTLVLKPAQVQFGFSDMVYSWIAMLVAFLTSLVLVLTVGDGATIFDAIGISVSNLIAAQIATALVLSLGNQALHQVYNLFIGWRTVKPLLAIEGQVETLNVTAEPVLAQG